MELAFAEKQLRDVCEHEAKAAKHYGAKVAERLQRRLSDLCSAETLGEVVAGRPELVDGEVRFQLADGYVLIVRGDCEGTKWKNSIRAKVVQISKL